jgi:hypothetical protein
MCCQCVALSYTNRHEIRQILVARTNSYYHPVLLVAFYSCTKMWGVCGGSVSWGTALQVGRSRVRFPMVSLELSIDIILPAALWHLTGMSTRNTSWRVKAAGAYGWQPYPRNSGSLKLLEPSGPVQGLLYLTLTLRKSGLVATSSP